MKKLILAMVLLFAMSVNAQEPITIKVWENGAPNSNGLTGEEVIPSEGRVGNITNPMMYIYKADPAKNTGAAVIICPGGGYVRLAIDHEGHQIAKWLAENGITGIVLKYRMPNGNHEVPLSDASQAMIITRSKAAEWGVNPKKVGIAGGSAGGHLASTLATHFNAETRPDFAILFYPVITMDPTVTHAGSAANLIGKDLKPELIKLYSNETQITPNTPPTLMLLSDDDTAVPSENSVRFYQGLKKNNVPASICIFPRGGHGWGFNSNFTYHENWKNIAIKWLKDIKITE